MFPLIFVLRLYNILISSKVFSLVGNSAYHGFCDEVYDFVGYFKHFLVFYHSNLENNIIGLFVVNMFLSCFNFLQEEPIYKYPVTCSSCFLATSFLFFRKKIFGIKARNLLLLYSV